MEYVNLAMFIVGCLAIISAIRNANENASKNLDTILARILPALISKNSEEYKEITGEDISKMPEQQVNELLDMYSVDENILIKKLEEENADKQNKDKEG